MAGITYRLAKPEDDEQLRELINSTTMPDDIELIYKKDPDFFHCNEIKGHIVQNVVGQKDGRICTLASRSLMDAYINGEKQCLGYLSDLKIAPQVRQRGTLTSGFSYLKTLMDDNRAKLHITTIIDGNRAAKISLTWKNKSPAIPNYYDFGLVNNYLILPVFKRFYFKKYKVVRGSIEILDEIVEFLNKEGKNKQFFPVYTKDYFLNLRDFDINDFYAAYENGKIVGVMAKWNQINFKQIMVKAYHNRMKMIKKFFCPFLPHENQVMKFFYISFFAAINADIFNQLLCAVYNDNYRKKYLYFSLSLHEKDSFNKIAKKFLLVNYKSRLYISEYKTDDEIAALVDERVPYLEAGIL